MNLVLCLEYQIDQHGGTEVLVRELIRGLSSRHRIVLVSADTPASFANSTVADFVAEHISWDPARSTDVPIQVLAEQIKRAEPDLVHFHLGGNYGWKSRAFSGCPIVRMKKLGLRCLSTNHGVFSILDGYCGANRSLLIKLALFLPAWASKLCVLSCVQTEIAVSRNDYRHLRRRYFPLRGKFRSIYHSRIRESAPPETPSQRRKVILCAGTIGARKGQTILVEAFSRIAPQYPEWQLVLIGRNGDQSMMARIRELISEHRLEERVRVLGERSDEELHDWMLNSAIFAMPSLSEGLGLSLQEAQFYGCACVGTRCGGVEDLIEDGNDGLLVPAGEVEPLGRALERLMSDDGLRERLRLRGPQSVLEKGMTADQMVAAYEQLYRQLLDRPS